MIINCPYTKNELVTDLETIIGESKHKVTKVEIDETKKEIRWIFDKQTFIQGMSFEVLNVMKVTKQNPLTLFMAEYKKSHPEQTGASMPNIPSMLQEWAVTYNAKLEKNKN